MALPLDKLGTTYPEHTAVVDPERARAYAAATNDDTTAYVEGRLAPPVFAVVPTWEAMSEVVADLVPPEALMMIVHGEQDMHFHAPLVPGATLVTRATPHSVRVGRSGTRLTVQVDSTEPDGRPVVTQYATTFIRGMTDGESAGPDKPGHDLVDDARGARVGDFSVHVDDDQTFRYRDASGDMMPIHVDDDVARSVGLPGIIAHGLCTMAMTGQAVVKTTCGGDPARLRRLAVRFAANVFPGSDVVTTIYDAGDEGLRSRYAFEATSGGETVIKQGLAEIDAPMPA
jgi:acyl dehydratase